MKKYLEKFQAFLTEQKAHKQRLVLFACLAVLATFGTVTALKLYGQALNYKKDVLECAFEIHEHGKDCENDDGELVCGYLDYVIHEHDSYCYDWNGKLACGLGEYELHEHDEDCYKEVRTLACGEKEGRPKTDTKASSSNSERELICNEEEHSHGAACYSGGGTCDMEEHTHSDACQSKTLACGESEHTHGSSCQSRERVCGESEHSHGDGCYDEEGEQACGKDEHSHDDGCYETSECGLSEHRHDDSCYDVKECDKEEHRHDDSCSGDAELTCGKEEHEHGSECWSGGDDGEDAGSEEVTGHVHDDGCYETEERLVCEKLEPHEHGDDCFDEDGNWTCGEWELLEHQHDGGCLVTKELTPEEIADIGEQEHHLHTEDCYDEDGELVCGYPAAHGHEDWCYDEDGELICGYGTEEHVHVDKCYDEDGNLICGYEGACHLHDASCYDKYGELVCGYGSFYHEHDEDCYDEDGNLICGYLEKEHEHTDDCYDKDGNLVCKHSENHLHGPDCYDEEGNLICGLTALKHRHTDECYDADGNLVCGYDELDFELRTEVEGITIILSGPPSSFDPEKEYSIEAELVWQEETISVIEDAMSALEDSLSEAMPAAEYLEDYDSGVESATKVDGYYAFDIKLLADGEETEPLGPVSVRFEGSVIEEAVDDEDTVSMVLHLDDETGDLMDMEAVEEDGAMAFETDHFSIYVYVNLKDILFGKIKLTVEHWGEGITTVDGTAVATGVDNAFEGGNNPHVKTKQVDCEIYATDEIEVPNEYYTDIRTLSKLYNAGLQAQDGGDAPEEGAGTVSETRDLNYTMLKFWVSTDMDNAGKEEWAEGTYKEYDWSDDSDVLLRMSDKDAKDGDLIVDWGDDSLIGRGCLVRFWYEPIKADGQYETPAAFYDYDITSGQTLQYGSLSINSDSNIRSGPDTTYDIVYHHTASGSNRLYAPYLLESSEKDSSNRIWLKIGTPNGIGWIWDQLVTWVVPKNSTVQYIVSEEQGINSDWNFTGSRENRMGMGQQASGNLSDWAMTATGPNGKLLNRFNNGNNAVVKGLVGDTLVDGQLTYNVSVPKGGFFGTEALGITKYANYDLLFQQDGDTYTLQSVYDKSNGSVAAGNLTDFSMYTHYPDGKAYPSPVYSNNFWPMDGVQNADPHMGAEFKQYRFLYDNRSELQKADAPNYSDDGLQHNWHFGMEYKVEFTVGDYTGPMEYYFRGDDDLWLYIDEKLAVDIGGIHSSAGETLDIRKFMEDNGMLENKDETHYMRIFYMERGGFGSCCYMQFTLPNSLPVEVDAPETTSFSVRKDWADGNENFAAFRPESIWVELVQILDGSQIQTNETQCLNKDNNWTYEWHSLPKINGASQGAYQYGYTVKEIDIPGYKSEFVGGVLTNTLESTSVSFHKSWCGDNGTGYNPGSAMFQLYCRAEGTDEFLPYKDIRGNVRVKTLDGSEGWAYTFDNLPLYTNYQEHSENGEQPYYTADALEYMVYEVYQAEDGTLVPYLEGELVDGLEGSKYEVSYGTGEDGISVTNTLVSEMMIVKKGATPDGTPSKESIAGATFSLVPYSVEGGDEQDGTPYTGISGDDGVVTWSNGSRYVPEGTWLLSEMEAPDNFDLSEEKWIISCGSGEGLPSVRKYAADGDPAVAIAETEILEDGTAVLSFHYYDYLTVYGLPETGGEGSTWYAFAGVLAVLAGLACLTYKKRKKGL